MKLRLSNIEKQSAVWAKLRVALTERLDSLRKQNDGDKNDTETAKIRGRIAEIKIILDAENKEPSKTEIIPGA